MEDELNQGSGKHQMWITQERSSTSLDSAHVRSVLNYPPGGWQPWINNGLGENLERLQNRGLRLIAGQSMSYPCEALRA